MSNDGTTLSNFISDARQVEVPTTGKEVVDDIIDDLSSDSENKSKLRKIISIIEEDDNLSKEDIASDLFVKQFYAVHRIKYSLSNEFDKQTYRKYNEILAKLFKKLKQSGEHSVNMVEEYEFVMGQHRERFGSDVDIDIDDQIGSESNDDLMICIIEAFAKGGLTAAEINHRIDIKSIETLQQPNPYIVVVDPRTGPRRRPYLGDPSLLRQYLTRVAGKEIDSVDGLDDDRAAIVVDDTPLTKHQIRYQVIKYLDKHDIEAKPNNITEVWQNQYAASAQHARKTLLETIESHGIEKLNGNHTEWMEYLYNLIDDKIRMSQANSHHSKKNNVPEELATKLDDKILYSLESANVEDYDTNTQSNYVRQYNNIVGLIHYNLRRVTNPAATVLKEAVHRNNVSTIILGVSAMIGAHAIILMLSVTLLGIPVPEDATSISTYQPIHQLQAVITIGYLGMQFTPKSLVYSDKKWNSVFSFGMMSDAFELSILRGEFTTRIKESIKSLKNKI